MEKPLARPDTGPPVPPLPPDTVEPALRTYRLLLVNPLGIEALVYASAGAGRVLLDSVAARDSSRVDIRVRARRVRMEAADAAGRPLAAELLELRSDTLLRWRVGRTAGGR